MEQVENAKQLPVLQPQKAVASSASYGKFRNADELLRAYLNLEAEFTRKSQKLKSLIKGKNDDFENLTNEVISFNANEKLSAIDCEKAQENLLSNCSLDNLSDGLNEQSSCQNLLQEKNCEEKLELEIEEEKKVSEEFCEKENDKINPLKSCDDNAMSNNESDTENFVQKMRPTDSSSGKNTENSSYILGLLDGAKIDGELKDELKDIAKNSGEGSVVLALAYKISAMKNKLSDNDLLKEVVNSNSIVKQHVIKNYIEEINSLNLPNLSVGKYPSFTAQKAYKPKSISEAGNIAKGLF